MAAGEYGLGEISLGIASLIFSVSVLTWKVNGLVKLWIIIGLFVASLFVIATVDYDRYQQKLAAYEGDLIAADEPDPPTHCPSYYTGKYRIYMGDSAIITDIAQTALVVIKGKVMLSISKNRSNSALQISLKIFDPSLHILAEIENNHYTISSGIFRKKQNDLSGFTLTDQYDHEVLRIRYLNQHSFMLTGSLMYMAGIEITDGHMFIFPNRLDISQFCSAGGKIVIN